MTQQTENTTIYITEKVEIFGLSLEAGDVVTINGQNQLHSANDMPSVIRCEGMDMMWHHNGKLHREHGPAWIMDSGKVRYFKHGQLII